MVEDKSIWEGAVESLGKGICGRIFADGRVGVFASHYRSGNHNPMGNEAEQVWRAAFLDLRATSKKVVETQTRDSRDRAIDELAEKIGMET